MKPAPFDYCCPDSVEEALGILTERGSDAKVMAGGQSLTPMLNFRVVRPEIIVDISRLIELDYVCDRGDGGLTVGALTRHRVMETSPQVARVFPVIPETMKYVAHLAIRNRGTIGGSLSHADPAAELPMLSRLLDATIVAQSVRGERVIASEDFFLAPLTSCLEDDELVVRVELPGMAHNGWAFEEFSRRAGDFALAAVGVMFDVREREIVDVRIAMMGVGDTPLRRHEAEASLLGRSLDEKTMGVAIDAACDSLEPRQDLQASPAFRRHLARAVMERVMRKAWKRATGETA
ncbi:FAD binding domain-containing protein [Pseudorhodoferax soli]|uniref:Carbon-monoxide dehydrogenase medium subunit n=1 Tax=Pseudorhodoferax soli TaxID=545864 RepID=A0A368XND3_9BURK|nr:xanthine dehydrogenase family protein subunit M [Pseudorhodoferax soli]RCW68528.1 carbon-monoxide dehydrogenase medium subunit [Pseudorhodoferax soli]